MIEESTFCRENLDAIVEIVSYEDPARVVGVDTGRLTKLAGTGAIGAPRKNKLASISKLADTVIPLIGDIDKPSQIDGNTPRRSKLTST